MVLMAVTAKVACLLALVVGVFLFDVIFFTGDDDDGNRN